MIFSRTYGFVFVHIPKTAGTTVETVFQDLIDPARDIHITRDQLWPPARKSLGLRRFVPLRKHATATRIRLALGGRCYDSQFSFAFARNPYARAYSCWAFVKAKAAMIRRLQDRPGPQRVFPDAALVEEHDALSFDDVCQNLRGVTRKLSHYRPQVAWLPRPGSVDFVGRVENLAADLARVFDKIGATDRLPATIPVRNQKTEPDEWRGMSAASAAAIRDFYAADFERFEYETKFSESVAA